MCTLTQKNLKVGVYGTGQLHPEKENGVLCKSHPPIIGERLLMNAIVYQNLAKEAVLAHLKDEKEAGKEIYPAFAGLSVMGDEGNEADKSKLNYLFQVNNCSLRDIY